MEVKSCIGVKKGKSYNKTLDASNLIGKKIGDKVDGSLIGLSGVELEITGGSDKSGFPMRADLQMMSRKRILTSKSTGVKKIQDRGCRIRKTVRGSIIANDIAQINFKVVKGDAEKFFAETPKEEAKK